MKTLFLFFLLSPVLVFCQKDTSNQSLIEKISQKSGSLIKKEFENIGSIKGQNLSIDLLRISSLSEPSLKQINGCRIEVTNTYSTYTAFLDADELGALINAMRIIQTTVFPDTATKYTEVIFKSKSGFQIGCYFDVKAKEWSAFVQVVTYTDKSIVFLAPSDFTKLAGLIQTVINKL